MYSPPMHLAGLNFGQAPSGLESADFLEVVRRIACLGTDLRLLKA
jgi:hypothetical protein